MTPARTGLPGLPSGPRSQSRAGRVGCVPAATIRVGHRWGRPVSGVPGPLRSALLRLRLDDHAGRAGAREGDPGLFDRSLAQRVDITVVEVGCGLEGNAASFGARALQ